jgi:hypothetical protein
MRARKETLTSEELHRLFDYDPETGALTWKFPMASGKIKPGTVAGSEGEVTIAGVQYQAGRVIWCMVHGDWPDGTLFFKNGDKADRRQKNIGLWPTPPADKVLTHKYLKKVLSYVPETGQFFHEVTGGGAQFGQLAGTQKQDGSWKINICGRLYYSHRLAWFYMHGKWPENDIDHKNLDRSDNRLDNLREATNSQNRANQRISKHNKTGVKGVFFRKEKGKFHVQCNHKYIGTLKTLEDAIAARIEAEIEMQGEYALTPRVGKRLHPSIDALTFSKPAQKSPPEVRYG